jgi:hypothetical protein
VGELLWNTSNPSGAFQLENFGPVNAAGTYDLGFGSATGAGGIGGATLETCDGQFYGGSGHYPASIDFYWSSTSGTLTPIGSAISVPLEDGDYALENVWTDPVPSNAVTVFVVIPSVSESPTFYAQYPEFIRPDTTTTVVSAVQSGSNLVLTATVTSTYYTACPSSGNHPTGDVQFYVNGSAVGSPVALTEVQNYPGTSSCSITVAAAGLTSAEAEYAGTASDLASSGTYTPPAAVLAVSPSSIAAISPYDPQSPLPYSLTIENTGGSTASDVVLTSNAPWAYFAPSGGISQPSSYNIGDIGAGDSVTVDVYFSAYCLGSIAPLPTGLEPQNTLLSSSLTLTSGISPITIIMTLAPICAWTGAPNSGGYGVRQVAGLGACGAWIW